MLVWYCLTVKELINDGGPLEHGSLVVGPVVDKRALHVG